MLSQRLNMVVKQVHNCDLLADIGTDHGYVPIYLITNKIAKRAIAADISKGSCDKARTNIAFYNMEDTIDVRCGNGLEVIKKNEAPDTILISGMGGLLAIEVLKTNTRAVLDAKQLILQPQRDIDKVRKYLHEIGFIIKDEDMLYEGGKYYTVINAVKGKEAEYSAAEYQLGKILLQKKSQVLKQFVEYENNKLNIVLENIKSNAGEDASNRIEQLEHLKKIYEEGLKCL